jgi:beta-aspartyl-peptidase (threonine type)
MRANLFLFLIVLPLAIFISDGPAYAKAVPASENASKAAVEQVLRVQQDAWNRHDLEAFMKGYWNSPALTFFSGASEHNGWQATLDRYRESYASAGHGKAGVLWLAG